jgi:hypothetical protein
VHLKVYTDEEWLFKTLNQYNGVQGKEHGGYKFTQIDWIRTERLASATNLRSAAATGDRTRFYKDMGIKPSVTINVGNQDMPVFDVVAHYLNQFPAKVNKEKSVAEEAAGVGIITKQNSTADVNASTPGKNLRAFKLAEEIAAIEQQILDLQESSQKKISKRVQQATTGLNTFGDGERISGDYTSYRLGMAVAGANGKDPIDMKAKSWIGKSKSTHPYTKAEQDMLKQAYKAVGASYKDVNNGDMKSKELDSTNKMSPIANPKKNQYGV